MATDRNTILAAAERLQADTGRLPTVEEVRAALGGGSFSTITPVLRAWKQEQKAAQSLAPEIPERVRAGLERATGALWAAFREEMDERIEPIRQEAARRAEEAESERDQALAEVTRLEQVLAATEARGHERQAELRTQLGQVQAERGAAGEEIARLTERTGQQEKRLESLSGELDHAHQERQAQAERHERALEQANVRAAAAAEQLDAVKHELGEARTQCARLEDRAGALKEQLSAAKEEGAQRAEALEKAITETVRQGAALEAAQEALAEARSQVFEAQAREQAGAREQAADSQTGKARTKTGGGKKR